jgi:Leu/Phe-tRNA-protein transferase
MNLLASPENVEQLLETFWRRIARKHNKVHGRQRFLTTIDDCFSNVMSAILQKNNGAAMPWINP